MPDPRNIHSRLIPLPALWEVAAEIITADYSASLFELVRCDPSGGALAVTLPATVDGEQPHEVLIKNVTGDTTAITVTADSGGTIDGAASAVITSAHGSVRVISTGTANAWAIADQVGSSGGGGGPTYLTAPATVVGNGVTAVAFQSLNAFSFAAGSGGATATLPTIAAGDIGKRVECSIRITGGEPDPGDFLTIAASGGDVIGPDGGVASVSILFGRAVLYAFALGRWEVESGAPL